MSNFNEIHLNLKVMKRLKQHSTKGLKNFPKKGKFSFDAGLKGLGVVNKWDVELAVKK